MGCCRLTVVTSLGLLFLLTVYQYYAHGTPSYAFRTVARSILATFESSANGGRTNGNGVIFDGDVCDDRNGYHRGDARFRSNDKHDERTFYDGYTDTITEMKRYASEKTAMYASTFPDDVEELKVDGMSDFACSVCVNDTDYDQLSHVVLGRLKSSIPPDVYDTFKDSLLIKNMTYEGSFQNCTKPLQDSGRAQNFLGWWTIRYDKKSDRYSACVVVSGVDITVSDDIVDYKVQRETIHVADEPCHCGFFKCESCPVFRTIETRSPVFKKHSITLKQHDNLKSYMMYKSVELIKGLAYDNNNVSLIDSKPQEALKNQTSMDSSM